MPARSISRFWQHNPTLYAPARYRKACRYDAYIPALLAEQALTISTESAGVISDAEGAIRELNAFARPALAPLARLLLRSESIASSRIEGLQVGVRELARAEVRAETGRSVGSNVLEVLANIDAMQIAVEHATDAEYVTVSLITAIHAKLMATAPTAVRMAGRIRDTQNWIGGNDYNPCGADFVPAPPEHVGALMGDLCDAINDATLPPLVQAALVHAQFETIHPFEDGNGRTGRALIQVVLRRRKLAPDYVPPISIVLAQNKDRYIEGLVAFRDDHIERWIVQFAVASARAAVLAHAYLARVNTLHDAWRVQLRHSPVAPRAGAAAWAVIDILPAYPVITAPVAVAATGRAKAPVYEALQQLVTAGVLVPVSTSPRKQSWEVAGLLDLLSDMDAGRAPG